MIDLDPDPETPSRAMRLGRLIRATLADRGLLQGEPLAEVCSRIAARQVPAANSAIRHEAILCLEPWLDSPLFGELQAAARARRAIERSVRWMLPWPLDGTAATVIRGRCDLIFRDRKGFWRPVVVSTHPALREADHLCLLLAGAAVDQLGKGPGGPALVGPGRPRRGASGRGSLERKPGGDRRGDLALAEPARSVLHFTISCEVAFDAVRSRRTISAPKPGAAHCAGLQPL